MLLVASSDDFHGAFPVAAVVIIRCLITAKYGFVNSQICSRNDPLNLTNRQGWCALKAHCAAAIRSLQKPVYSSL